ncbi:hypothetical protein, partial [Pseudomonas viridiflava]|uniref:hypothetical protein n=1 Tax=Pseudomonas viridiflava TaxID=33069 RepID=UPI001981259D
EKWAPIKTFFSGLFTDIKPFIDPILSWFGMGSEDKSLLQKALKSSTSSLKNGVWITPVPVVAKGFF